MYFKENYSRSAYDTPIQYRVGDWLKYHKNFMTPSERRSRVKSSDRNTIGAPIYWMENGDLLLQSKATPDVIRIGDEFMTEYDSLVTISRIFNVEAALGEKSTYYQVEGARSTFSADEIRRDWRRVIK